MSYYANTQPILVTAPCAACPVCLSTFNLTEWRALKMSDEQPPGGRLERRHCSECETGKISLYAEGLDELDFSMPIETYVDSFGADWRTAAAAKRAHDRRMHASQNLAKKTLLLQIALFVALCLTILAAARIASGT